MEKKKRIFYLHASLWVVFLYTSMSLAGPRKQLFDNDWWFARGDFPDVQKMSYGDSGWRKVDLPHDWSIEDIPGTESPYDIDAIGGKATGFAVGGTGWYVKNFSLDQDYAGKRISILFEGVYMDADVWINGHHLGNHPYGYTSFYYDITDHVKTDGSNNRLAVQVKNEGKNTRWYSGSGIYRHVWLITVDPIHIAQWGTFVKTKSIDKNQAEIEVETTVRNDSQKNQTVTVRVNAIDPQGKAAGGNQTTVLLSPAKSKTVKQTIQIANTDLWSTNNPALYTLKSTIVSDGESIDQTTTPFGIRTLEFDPQKGFLLNGKVTKLRGGCMHHDNGPLGACAFDRAEHRRVELMKANGFNAIRTAHNPPSPAFLDACDKNGMLVINELFDGWFKGKNEQDYKNYFFDWWEKDLESFVLRDRNHPSVILWSTSNEIMDKMDPKAWKAQQDMVDAFRKLDPTRKVTCGINLWANVEQWDTVLAKYVAPIDVIGYNYRPKQYEDDFKKYPDRLIYCSESLPRLAFDYWMPVKDNHFVIGDFVWIGFDYLGESGVGWIGVDNIPYPWTVAYCGDIDICGFPRPQSYYRQILWNTGPKIAVFVHGPQLTFKYERKSNWSYEDVYPCWTWPGYKGGKLKIDVYSNCEKVVLSLNGRQIGTQPTNRETQYKASFEVPYEEGTLTAAGYNGEKLIEETRIQTVGKLAQIKLTADRTTLTADGQDLAFITAELTDAEGRRRPFAENLVRFKVEGAGTLAAVGNAKPTSTESFQRPQRHAFKGRCLLIIRTSQTPGAIIIRAFSDGLKSAILELKTEIPNK